LYEKKDIQILVSNLNLGLSNIFIERILLSFGEIGRRNQKERFKFFWREGRMERVVFGGFVAMDFNFKEKIK